MSNQDNWNIHWEDFSESASLNPAQTYRRLLIIRQIKKIYKPSLNMIDIGCGNGDLACKLVTTFSSSSIYGIDFSDTSIEICKQKAPTAYFFKMNLSDNSQSIPKPLRHNANIAICSEVLEHLDNPLLFLKKTSQLLAKHSTLIITVPSGPRSAFDMYIGHRKHFKANELKELLLLSGYKVQAVYTAGFPFFNLYKLITILRGQRLISDSRQKKISLLAKLVMRCFALLFKFNLKRFPGGWQLIAIATYDK
ncbi:MAG TPA: class I SAM-dependent methyltransferase [Gammaproteobacteria bacterium]|nr:class I SAM-dependent methyltransferase [Gammaproteobacteria bacterium]